MFLKVRGRFLACFLFCSALIIPAHGSYRFYVSPDGSDNNDGRSLSKAFLTITRAQEEITKLNKMEKPDEPVEIQLADGLHIIKKPLIFTPDNSGTQANPVIFAPVRGARPVISGGKVISGFQKHKSNIWKTVIPEVKAGNWNFTQLFVNGKLRHRSRKPNNGFLIVAGFPDGGREVHYHTDCQRFEFKKGDIDPSWQNINDVEVIVYHFWTDSHLPIKSIDTEKNIVTFKHKAGKVFTDDFTSNGARYIVENVFEELDAPGEWYLNRKTGELFYIPMVGEDMSKAKVIAPFGPAFMEFKGDPVKRKYVEHIRFHNLAFMYTNWQLPGGNSNDRQGSASVPAAIKMTGARYCVFSNCKISNTGTWAFEISNGSARNVIAKNELSYLAAGGIRVNGATESGHPLERTGYNLIADNHLHHYGEVYPSAVGVLLMNTHSNKVVHNHIHHGWYTGVSIGWQWGYQRSISRDNKIEFNHIHDIGQGLLSDMGAVYTLGISPGTTISSNLIHDVNANHYGGWGIYNDEGSSHILVENNIVYNTKFAGYNIHFCKEVTVRNNIFAFGRLQQLSRSRAEPHISCYFENNIVYFREGVLLDKNWKDREYTFHFHPKNSSGTRKTSRTFDMDWNIYYNPTKKVEEVQFNGMTFDQWKKKGKDKNSLYTDPLFADPDNYDFRLKENSPAFDLGFKQIDTSNVGPRDKAGLLW